MNIIIKFVAKEKAATLQGNGRSVQDHLISYRHKYRYYF